MSAPVPAMAAARWAATLLAGLLAHLLVLVLPLLLLASQSAAVLDGRVLVFLAGATGLCLADLTMPGQVLPERLLAPRPRGVDSALAGAGAAALLVVFWVSLVEHLLAGVEGPSAGAAAGAVPGAGLALFASGAIARHAAGRALGVGFVDSPEPLQGRPLVRRSVYRVVRHPAEAGLLGAGLAAPLQLGSVRGALAWAVLLLPLTLVRIHREERALVRHFGDAYASYRLQAGCLLPRVRRRQIPRDGPRLTNLG